uniref:Fibrinogen C-terminal domain-containing protein n=1 Tax=Mola mola TaxID=94237 RepID=A0A3Q3WR48_MOLML
MKLVRALLSSIQAAENTNNPKFFLPIDCYDIHRNNNKTSSGVYTIYPGGPTAPLKVYCDMDTEGAWTVIQRRLDGTENFYRPWSHYNAGFGNVDGEYWLGEFRTWGLKKSELQFDMEDWTGEKASASYSSFSIDSENSGYQLYLGSFTGGIAGDSFSNQNNMKFTIFDRDQDQWDKNCAQHFLGGSWYNACHMANPKGMYAPHGTWKGWNYSLKAMKMKIRPVAKCSCTEQYDYL